MLPRVYMVNNMVTIHTQTSFYFYGKKIKSLNAYVYVFNMHLSPERYTAFENTDAVIRLQYHVEMCASAKVPV